VEHSQLINAIVMAQKFPRPIKTKSTKNSIE